MARPATKKVASKAPKKNRQAQKKKPQKTSTVIDKVEQGFRSAYAEVDRQQDNLRVARATLRARRVEAAKKGTRASQALVDRAYAAVTKGAVSLDESHRKAGVAKAKVRVSRILRQVESAELNVEEKLLALEVKLTEQAEEHLKTTLEKFEARWRKKRALTDTRKLKLAKRNASSKVKNLAKKAQAEIRVVEKKAAKALATPVKTPGRPGRPKKQGAGQAVAAKAAPKKRGRPAKAKTASVVKSSIAKTSVAKVSAAKAAPKKRGRPAKVKVASAAPKKRGRPAKPKAASTTAKKRGRPAKVAAGAKAKTASAASAPKRRGRPPKAK